MLTVLSSGSALAKVQTSSDWGSSPNLNPTQSLSDSFGADSNLYWSSHSQDAIDSALKDKEGLIRDAFHVPSEIQPAVRFWMRVYAELSSQQVIVFDSRHPEVVYEVLDFRELSRTSRSRMVYEILRERKMKAVRAAYVRGFDRLARKARPSKLSREEKLILQASAHLPHHHSYRDLGAGLRMQTGQRDNVIHGIMAAEPYFPALERVFSTTGVPVELTRLPLVESSFNLKATSKVGATGVWQFMKASGQQYLTIDDRRHLDERLNPLKSAVAATKLLKLDRKIVGNWPLAITAYNHGFTRLPRNLGDEDIHAIAKLFDLCSKKSPLGWASRNYYLEFLAMLHVEKYRHLFFGVPPTTGPIAVTLRQVVNKESGLSIALKSGVSVDEFRRLNPDIRDLRQTLPPGFWIVLPGDQDNLATFHRPRRSHGT